MVAQHCRRAGGGGDGAVVSRFATHLHYPPLQIRFNTSMEPTHDLQNPVFDECTVPYIIYAQWIANYAGEWAC